MPKLVHFEILADKPERAVEFYKKVFKLMNISRK